MGQNFRSTQEYSQIIQDFFATTMFKYKLTAADIVVIATALGVIGTEPIRKNTKVPEMAEALIQDGMERGKEAFKAVAKAVAILGPSRRHKAKKPLFSIN